MKSDVALPGKTCQRLDIVLVSVREVHAGDYKLIVEE